MQRVLWKQQEFKNRWWGILSELIFAVRLPHSNWAGKIFGIRGGILTFTLRLSFGWPFMKRMRLCYDMLSLISKPGSKGPKDPKATKTNTPLLSVCIADLCWSLRRSRVSNTTPRAASPSWALPLPGAPRSGWSWWPQPRTELAPGGFPTVVQHNEDGNTTRLLTLNTFQICLQGPRC